MPFKYEKLKEPFVNKEYPARKGYDAEFLGITVPMPGPADLGYIAPMEDGEHMIPYEHFSLVLQAERRLALITASNVNGNPKFIKPEPGRGYTRRDLSGLSQHDHEKWVIDGRLDLDYQLSDKFSTKDNANFDKGHIVKRDDVAWGDTYEELRRARIPLIILILSFRLKANMTASGFRKKLKWPRRRISPFSNLNWMN